MVVKWSRYTINIHDNEWISYEIHLVPIMQFTPGICGIQWTWSTWFWNTQGVGSSIPGTPRHRGKRWGDLRCGASLAGVTLNWGVLLAWSGLQGSLQWPVAPLYLACVLYTMFYDTIYSHQVLAHWLWEVDWVVGAADHCLIIQPSLGNGVEGFWTSCRKVE